MTSFTNLLVATAAGLFTLPRLWRARRGWTVAATLWLVVASAVAIPAERARSATLS